MKTIDHKIIRQLFVLFLIIVIGWIIIKELLPFLSGILGAITLYVLLRRLMEKMVNSGWRTTLAAVTLMIGSFFAILIPLAGAVIMLTSKINEASRNSAKVVSSLKEQVGTWEHKLNYDLSSQFDSQSVASWVSENLSSFAGGAFNALIAVSIMYFLLFYMLTNRKELRDSLADYLPISKVNLEIIGIETRKMVRANAIGIPLVAVAQGIVALIGFLIFGIENAFFWAVIVTIGSMIPFIGNFLGTIPVFILSLSSGTPLQAWGILLYGIIVVGTTDNVIRLFVLNKLDDVHPLITLIGVIIGIPVFGFIGLIFGPLLLSLFLVIIKIYKKEYGDSRLEDGEVLTDEKLLSSD